MLTKIKTAIVAAILIGAASAAVAAPHRNFDFTSGQTIQLQQGMSVPVAAGP